MKMASGRGEDDGNSGNGIGDDRPYCPCHAHFVTHHVIANAIAYFVVIANALSVCNKEDNGEVDKSDGNGDGNCDKEGNGDGGKSNGDGNVEGEGKGGKRDEDGNKEGNGKGGKGNGNGD
jgi:hypothetical protein